MSLSGFPNNPSSGNPAAIYGRGDLQAAFNWLVNQPEHIRKQASDPDRLMTLYYRSSGRPELARPEAPPPEPPRMDPPRMETEAPVSSQNFISDLRQINEAMRQFDRPPGYASANTTAQSPAFLGTSAPLTPGPTMSPSMASALSQSAAFAEVRTPAKLNPTGSSLGSSAAHPTAPLAALPPTAAIISEVREKLNLSSDSEAINALVAIGYKSLKPLLG